MSKKVVLNNKLYKDDPKEAIDKIQASVADITEKITKNEKLTEEEAKRYGEAHKQIQDELAKPVYLEKLTLLPGEIYFGETSQGDQFQVLVRYMNDISVFLKNQMILTSTLCNYVAILSKKLHNIDVDEEMQNALPQQSN